MVENGNGEYVDRVKAIVGSELTDIEKLREGFGMDTGAIVEYALSESELAKAAHDRDALIKVQIKMETMKAARRIFDTWYTLIAGRKAWDE